MVARSRRTTQATASGTSASDLSPLTSGQEVFPRLLASSSTGLTSGRLYVTHFTARKSETLAGVRTVTTGTAGGTLTLVRWGLYDPAGALVASTANDTTKLAAAYTSYATAFSAGYAVTSGLRYAVGLLVVGGTMPTVISTPVGEHSAELAQAPAINGSVDAQANLPANLPGLDIGGAVIYTALTV